MPPYLTKVPRISIVIPIAVTAKICNVSNTNFSGFKFGMSTNLACNAKTSVITKSNNLQETTVSIPDEKDNHCDGAIP